MFWVSSLPSFAWDVVPQSRFPLSGRTRAWIVVVVTVVVRIAEIERLADPRPKRTGISAASTGIRMIYDFFGARICGDRWHRQERGGAKNQDQPPEFHKERV